METKPADSIFRQVLVGGLWTLGLRLSSRALGFARTIVLARLLFPADFGLIAMAMLVVTGLDNITQTGFQQALIQKKSDIEGCLDTAWTVTLMRNLVLCLILVLAAPLVAGFFEAPRLTDIIRVVSLSVLLSGLANIGIVFFQKDLEFDRQFGFEWWASLAEFALTVLLAFLLRDVWALVWGGLAGNVLRVWLSYALHPYRPSFTFNPAVFRELLDFGKWVSGFAVVGYAVSQMDSILIGRILGAEPLGYYQMAFLTAVIPSSEVAIAVSMVVFPSYSMLQDQPGRLRESFEKVLQVAAMVCMPIGFGILAVAPEFVRIVLGERWQGIAPIMQVLSIMGIAKALEGTTNSLVMAVGRPGWLMGFSALQLCLLAAGLYPLTSRWGIHGAAIAVTSTALIAAAAALVAAVRITGSNGRRTLTLIAVPLGASMAMAAGIILLKRLTGAVALPGLLFLVAAGVGLYAACLIAADAALTSGRYRDLAADLLKGLRASGERSMTPLSDRADGVAAAVRSDDLLR
jgi:lipopolysaccharide exporter